MKKRKAKKIRERERERERERKRNAVSSKSSIPDWMQSLTWAIKKLISRASMSLLWHIFYAVFVLPFINTLFDLSSLKITFSSEQTNVWFKIIGDYFVLPT